MDGDAVNCHGKTITKSLVTGDLLLAFFWGSFRIFMFTFHSSWPNARPCVLAGGFPVMS